MREPVVVPSSGTVTVQFPPAGIVALASATVPAPGSERLPPEQVVDAADAFWIVVAYEFENATPVSARELMLLSVIVIVVGWPGAIVGAVNATDGKGGVMSTVVMVA